MKATQKLTFLLLLFGLTYSNVDSQNTEDSVGVKLLINLAESFRSHSNYKKADSIAQKALVIAEKTNFEKGQADALNLLATDYWFEDDYSNSENQFLKALKIEEPINYLAGLAESHRGLGDVYFSMNKGDSIVKIEENKALKIYKNIGNEDGMGNALEVLGRLYDQEGTIDSALIIFQRAQTYFEHCHDNEGISYLLIDIGDIYDEQKDYPKAMHEYYLAVTLNNKIRNKDNLSTTFLSMSQTFLEQRKFDSAFYYADTSLSLGKAIPSEDDIMQADSLLARIYENKGEPVNALKFYRNYVADHDSIFSQRKAAEFTRTEIGFEQEKKDVILKQERKREAEIRNTFIGGFILMGLLAFFIFRGYSQKKRSNIIISSQMTELARQKVLVEEQKKLVDDKNKDILDSITYAKRLQDAILPRLSTIKQCLPESFVMYKPKDIVAGDFYWMERAGDNILIAAADSTGHGVPGAMVSVVCSNALNRTVKEFKITEPGKILDKVRELVLETFEKSEDNVQDGMDISLCRINAKTNEAQWSGAYNSLWYIRTGELIEVPADKQPIGKNDKPQPFNTHNLNLQKGDTLYLFTDGYPDQFGGPKGKKFKYKLLQELLLANAAKSMEDQKKALEVALESWKGNLEQVDDILVIGIRV